MVDDQKPEKWRFYLDANHLRYLVVSLDGHLRLVEEDPHRRWFARDIARDTTLHRFDVRTKDAYTWRGYKRFLLWLNAALPAGQKGFARHAYKRLRAAHHESKSKEWDDVLPRGIARWANGELNRASNGLSCCDNFRAARLGNTGQMRRYRRQRERGCCGSRDWEALGPDGKVYMLGFNYGH